LQFSLSPQIKVKKGASENAGLELNGPKSQRWEMKDQRPRSISYSTHFVIKHPRIPTRKTVDLSE